MYHLLLLFFFVRGTATSGSYTLSLHDALPISLCISSPQEGRLALESLDVDEHFRSEEHTSELQSRFDLVCRLLLEKKNQPNQHLRDRHRVQIGSAHV